MGEVKRVGDILGSIEELPLKECNCEKHGVFFGKPVIIPFGGTNKIFDPSCPTCEKEGEKRGGTGSCTQKKGNTESG